MAYALNTVIFKDIFFHKKKCKKNLILHFLYKQLALKIFNFKNHYLVTFILIILIFILSNIEKCNKILMVQNIFSMKGVSKYE